MTAQASGFQNALGALAAGSDSAETLDQPQIIHSLSALLEIIES